MASLVFEVMAPNRADVMHTESAPLGFRLRPYRREDRLKSNTSFAMKIISPTTLAVRLASRTAPAAMIQGPATSAPCFLVQTAEQSLDGAVEQFRRQHQTDAADQHAPLQQLASKNQRPGQHQRREKKMH